MNKATNAALMRLKNEKIILSLIYNSPVSRVDISNITGLTKAAVTIIVDDFKKRGIIREEQSLSKSVGRNPVMLYLNSDAFFFAGVNISRSKITVGIVDIAGKVITNEEFAICPPDEAYIKIAASIKNQIEKSNIPIEKIHKISVVTPGPVDTADGRILNPPNFSLWHNECVAKKLSHLTSMEVILQNVSSAVAIAENYFGLRNDAHSFLSLTVNEGIGSGIISHGVLFTGPCEIGHMSIQFDGKKCECGNRGCLEQYAAIPNILENTPYRSWQEVVDNNCLDIMKKEAQYISSAIISARNIFDFDKVFLCGDLTYKADSIVSLVEEQIKKRILANDNLEVCAGSVKSRYLVAASVGIYDLFNL